MSEDRPTSDLPTPSDATDLLATSEPSVSPSTPGVHETAQAFGSIAQLYDRARPDYPTAALEAVIARLGVTAGRRILDLGAGTGKLTLPLLQAGADVTAIEPMEGMRTQLKRAIPEEFADRLTLVDASAEDLPLPDASAHGAAAGQAYHWFDPLPALAELHRVLEPGSWFAVLHNRRDLHTPPQAALEDLMRPHRGETPSWVDTSWTDSLTAPAGFTPPEFLTFPHQQTLDGDGFVGRVASVSFVAKLPAALHRQILETAGMLFTMLEQDGVVELSYTTELRLLQRTDE